MACNPSVNTETCQLAAAGIDEHWFGHVDSVLEKGNMTVICMFNKGCNKGTISCNTEQY